MAKSKKRARQAKRRAERRANKHTNSEPTPRTLLLRRIQTEARTRREAAAHRLADAEAGEKRRRERAGAQGRTRDEP